MSCKASSVRAFSCRLRTLHASRSIIHSGKKKMAKWLFMNKTHKSPFRFSRVWEDHRLVSASLNIQPDDEVLCITSAGDNILNLLLDEPKIIVAVDVNPAESALLELKIAAIKHLCYEDYLLVLGEIEDVSHKRCSIFKQIKEHLPKYAQKYVNDTTITQGISTSGWFQEDTIQHLNEYLSKVVAENDLDDFFAASTIEEQRMCFQKISSGLKETILSCLNREHVLATGWIEEHLVDVEAIHGDVSQYFLKHFFRVCQTLPARDNFYLSLLTRGVRGFSPDSNPELAPPFLQRKNFHKLKQLVTRVKLFTGVVQDCLLEPGAPVFNKIYLSNIFERMDTGLCQSILETTVDHMPPGGRLAYCTLLEPNKSPSLSTLRKLTYLEELSIELQKQDRMVMYSGFHVFSVK